MSPLADRVAAIRKATAWRSQQGLDVCTADSRTPLDTTVSPWTYAVEWVCGGDGRDMDGVVVKAEDNWHDVKAAVDAVGICVLVRGDTAPALWVKPAGDEPCWWTGCGDSARWRATPAGIGLCDEHRGNSHLPILDCDAAAAGEADPPGVS